MFGHHIEPQKHSFVSLSCGLYEVQGHRERLVPTGASSQGYSGHVYGDRCSQVVFQGARGEHHLPVWGMWWCFSGAGTQGSNGETTAMWTGVFDWSLCPCWDVLPEESRELKIEFCHSVQQGREPRGASSSQEGLQNCCNQWCSVPLFNGLNCGIKLKKKKKNKHQKQTNKQQQKTD